MDRDDFIDLALVSKQVPGKTPAQVRNCHHSEPPILSEARVLCYSVGIPIAVILPEYRFYCRGSYPGISSVSELLEFDCFEHGFLDAYVG